MYRYLAPANTATRCYGRPPTPVAFKHVKVFAAETGRSLDDQTVIADKAGPMQLWIGVTSVRDPRGGSAFHQARPADRRANYCFPAPSSRSGSTARDRSQPGWEFQ
jgi:hypothetical protein